MVVLVATGALIGPSVLGLVSNPLSGVGAQLLFNIGVALILFHGGTGISLRVISGTAVGLGLLVLPGVLLTAIIVALAVSPVFGVTFPVGPARWSGPGRDRSRHPHPPVRPPEAAPQSVPDGHRRVGLQLRLFQHVACSMDYDQPGRRKPPGQHLLPDRGHAGSATGHRAPWAVYPRAIRLLLSSLKEDTIQ
jgi:hypothetical protein